MTNSLFDLPFEEPQEPDADRDSGSGVREPIAPEPRRVFSVSQLTDRIRSLLEERFFEIWVEGEISNCFVAKTGHMYFTLKDTQAQIKAVMFRSAIRYLRFKPQDGLRVVARGRLTVYDPKGEYQIVCEHLEPEGLGARQLAFDQLKERLAREGLFDPRRKRALPALPRKIGVVTSLDGAAVRDIIKVLRRRYANAHIVIRPARVQGEGAALDIARGMAAIGKVKGVDVVIVGRGGGSIEDLWAFNEEVVARAIAGCPVPTISAVGHETDITIADFVADMRAPTPSAAAEIVVCTRESLYERLNAADHKLLQSVRLKIALLARALHNVAIDRARLHRAIGRQMQRVDELDYRLRELWRAALAVRKRTLDGASARLGQFDIRLKFAAARRRLDASDAALMQSMRLRLSGAHGELGPLEAHLKQLSPLTILERGYAIVERDGKIVKSPNDAPVGSEVSVRLAKGGLSAVVSRAHE